jgi:hypothetical protein
LGASEIEIDDDNRRQSNKSFKRDATIVLGCKNSAPEWYFPIQGTVRMLIFVGLIVGCLVGSQVVYGWRKKRGRI